MLVINKDHFSSHAKEYANYRPNYPESLFKYLASLTKEHQLAWDCATGNGQAAIPLAKYYNKVVATDISTRQIEFAIKHPKITYYPADCEHSGLADKSVDLITVAQSAHWFNMPLFEEECRRVIKTNGIVAIWMYSLFRVNLNIDAIIDNYYWNTLAEYWPEGRENIDQNYEKVNLTLNKIESPSFEMKKYWNFDEVIGYLCSWSSLQNYIKQNDANPIDLIKQDLAQAWGDIGDVKEIQWPLTLKVYNAS